MEAGAGADNFPISGGVSDYTFWMAVSVEGAETDPEMTFGRFLDYTPFPF